MIDAINFAKSRVLAALKLFELTLLRKFIFNLHICGFCKERSVMTGAEAKLRAILALNLDELVLFLSGFLHGLLVSPDGHILRQEIRGLLDCFVAILALAHIKALLLLAFGHHNLLVFCNKSDLVNFKSFDATVEWKTGLSG